MSKVTLYSILFEESTTTSSDNPTNSAKPSASTEQNAMADNMKNMFEPITRGLEDVKRFLQKSREQTGKPPEVAPRSNATTGTAGSAPTTTPEPAGVKAGGTGTAAQAANDKKFVTSFVDTLTRNRNVLDRFTQSIARGLEKFKKEETVKE